MSKQENMPEMATTGRGQMIDRTLYKKLHKKLDKAQRLLWASDDICGIINAGAELDGIICVESAPEVFGPILHKRIQKAEAVIFSLRELLDKDPRPLLERELENPPNGGRETDTNDLA